MLLRTFGFKKSWVSAVTCFSLSALTLLSQLVLAADSNFRTGLLQNTPEEDRLMHQHRVIKVRPNSHALERMRSGSRNEKSRGAVQVKALPEAASQAEEVIIEHSPTSSASPSLPSPLPLKDSSALPSSDSESKPEAKAQIFLMV